MFRFCVVFFLTLSLAHNAFANRLNGDSIISDSGTGPLRLTDDNLLVVELYLERYASGEYIEAYQYEGGVLVPFGAITRLIDFPIDVRLDEAVAQGWFIAENRTFFLDINRQEVIVDGKRNGFPKDLVIVSQGDIYVDSSLFSTWFPINLDLNFSTLSLILNPREKLPIQLRYEREQKRGRLSQKRELKDYSDAREDPYRLLAVPFVDFDLRHDYDNNVDPENQVSYSLQSQGDMGYFTSQISLVGDSRDSLTSLRVKAGRKDQARRLLWNKATEFSIGDIDSVDLSLVGGRSIGRGVFVSNVDLERADQFDTTNFIGDSLPGWEVELYRNGVLVNFLTVGNDGRYEFNDVEIFYGNNVFRLVFYGPQGQLREETQTINIDSAILPKGEFRYRFSLDEKSKTLFGVDEKESIINHDNELRTVISTEYGLTDRMTALFGVMQTPLEDNKTHQYQTLGLRNSFGPLITDANVAYDSSDGGLASELSAHSVVKDVNIRFRQKYFDEFSSESEGVEQLNPRKYVSELDFDGNIGLWKTTGLSYGLGGSYTVHQEDKVVSTLTNRLSLSFFGSQLANSINWRQTDENNTKTKTADGLVSIRSRIKGVLLRLSTNYQVEPLSEFETLNLSLQKQLKKEMNIRGDVQKDLADQRLTSFSLSVNKQFRHVRGSIVIGGDDNDNFNIGTRLSFALGREPISNRVVMSGRDLSSDGAVSASAFLDHNYNGEFDSGDERMGDVRFAVNGTSAAAHYKEDSPAFIPAIDPYKPVSISVDTGSIEDPFWMPANDESIVLLRPGHVMALDFPIVITTEIDGTVFFQERQQQRSAPHLMIELVDSTSGKIVDTTKTEFDGFYLFDKVIPGTYIVRVAKQELDKVHASDAESEPIVIEKDSDIISGIDLTIVDESALENVEVLTLPPLE